MKRSILWLAAAVAATIPLGCAAQTHTSDGASPAMLGNKVVRCKMGSDDAQLPAAVRGHCYSLRPNGPANTVLVGLADHEYFATSCTVRLVRGSHPGSKCTEENLLRTDDEIAITEWGNKEAFTLSLNRRKGTPPKMVAAQLPLTQHKEGNELVWLEAHDPVEKATYYVYLLHVTGQGGFAKRYVVEAFLDDPQNQFPECTKERPGQPGNIERLNTCPLSLTNPSIRENNSGGGGEPPPDPK